MPAGFDIQCTEEGILLGTVYGESYNIGASAARCYYELFDGTPTDQEIRGLFVRLGTGGREATAASKVWRWSIYGRRSLGGRNIRTLKRGWVRRSGAALYDWRSYYIPMAAAERIQCLVVKLECMAGEWAQMAATAGWDEEAELGANCPYGVRIKAATVYGSELGRIVTAPGVLKHIASRYYPSATAPTDARRYDQIAFRELPNDRWEAIDDVCGMTGWDYQVWDDDTLSFTDPGDAAAVSVPISQAGVGWDAGPDEGEAYNAVRVQYTNAKGRPREVILHSTLKLGDVVSNTIVAPETVKSESGAIKVAKRWLKAHGRIPETGSVTVTGTGPWGDALHLRPGVSRVGKETIQHVTLDPMEWRATLQFGVNVDTYEAWLARLAAGVKAKKR